MMHYILCTSHREAKQEFEKLISDLKKTPCPPTKINHSVLSVNTEVSEFRFIVINVSMNGAEKICGLAGTCDESLVVKMLEQYIKIIKNEAALMLARADYNKEIGQ